MVMAESESESAVPAVDSDAQKKEAAAWHKKKIARVKKVAATLKKVKNQRSIDKATVTIKKLYEEFSSDGSTDEAPDNEAMDSMAEKYEPQMAKLRKQIRKQIERIDRDCACLDTSELDRAIDKADIMDGILLPVE